MDCGQRDFGGRDGLGNVGKRSTSACAPKKDMEEVFEMNCRHRPAGLVDGSRSQQETSEITSTSLDYKK